MSNENEIEKSFPVELYVYDLSNGLARSMSLQLTGRYFEAIYHTSIVVYGREYYFGQGIFKDVPGRTHFGNPMKKIKLGETNVDEETFNEILNDLKERFTLTSYHLLEFNCNTFSNEVSNILIGKDIPSEITSLPRDFLSTPLGRMMGPQIDSMFRGNNVGNLSESSSRAVAAPPSAMGILNHVTQQATQKESMAIGEEKQMIYEVCNVNDFQEFLLKSSLSVIMFTNQNCGPCIQVYPEFESLAMKYLESKSFKERKIIFGKVESCSSSFQLMQNLSINVTPTFQFYKDGLKFSEVKGGNVLKLREEIENLLEENYKFHNHSKFQNPLTIVPNKFLIYKTIPNLMTLEFKVNEIISNFKSKSFNEKADLQESRSILTKILFPWLRIFNNNQNNNNKQGHQEMSEINKILWIKAIRKVFEILPFENLFPFIDLIRITLLDSGQIKTLIQSEVGILLIKELLIKTNSILDSFSKELLVNSKSTLITIFRLIENILANQDQELTKEFLENENLIALLIWGNLQKDNSIQSFALNSTFNWCLEKSKKRSSFIQQDDNDTNSSSEKDVEILCSILQSIENQIQENLLKEKDFEKLYKLISSFILLIYKISNWKENVLPLLQVIECKFKLKQIEEKIKKNSNSKESNSNSKEILKLLNLIFQLIDDES